MPMRNWAFAAAVALAASASNACMRQQMDDRAVQWSTRIVEAKLLSIDPPVKLQGEMRTFKPPFGVLATWYYYRVYRLQVIRSLDGPSKKGDTVTIVRLFWNGQQVSCQQNLTPDSIGKDFLAMLMPISTFKQFVPEGITGLKVKDGMFVVHLELKEMLSKTTIPQLEQRIAGVRAAEAQIDPKQVDRLIERIKNEPNSERAGPSLRALERMGPKIVPQLEAGLKLMPPDQRQSELYNVIDRLSPPATTQGMVWPDMNIQDDAVKK
jgi:hypothetical protein